MLVRGSVKEVVRVFVLWGRCVLGRYSSFVGIFVLRAGGFFVGIAVVLFSGVGFSMGRSD